MKGSYCIETSRMTSAISIIHRAFINVNTFLLRLPETVCTSTENMLDKDISINVLLLGISVSKGIHILDTESLYSMTASISRRACSTTESGHGVLARLFIETRISNITFVNVDTKSSISSKTSWTWTTTKERWAI